MYHMLENTVKAMEQKKLRKVIIPHKTLNITYYLETCLPKSCVTTFSLLSKLYLPASILPRKSHYRSCVTNIVR